MRYQIGGGDICECPLEALMSALPELYHEPAWCRIMDGDGCEIVWEGDITDMLWRYAADVYEDDCIRWAVTAPRHGQISQRDAMVDA